MSGISGAFGSPKETSRELSETVDRMLDAICHRAPLAEVLDMGEIAFGVRFHDFQDPPRVLEGGKEKAAAIIDGAIYNSPFHLTTSSPGCSDAQIILNLYKQYGDEFLDKIDGSYAIALWDAGKRRLLLARDRLGSKPLFYLKSGNAFYFASEIKSILAGSNLRKSVNLVAVNDFLSYGYVPNPETLFADIYQVRPGHSLILCDNSISETPYWRFKYQRPDRVYTESEYKEKFIELLGTAVDRRLRRHPVCGAFLSGGLDTSAVVAVMHKLVGSRFKVFTAGFEEEQFNETVDAKIVADHLGLEHFSVTIGFRQDLPQLLEKIVWHHDAPFADTSAIPSYFAAILAREHVPVVLTGDFPDQLIGGSGHHVTTLARLRSDPATYRLLRNRFFNRAVTRLPFSAGGATFSDKIKRMIYRETFSLEEQRILLNMPVPELLKRWLYTPELRRINMQHDSMRWARSLYEEVRDSDLLDKLLYFDSLSYAPDDLMVKVERMTMAHGLIALSPFHDREIVEFIASIPSALKIHSGSTKYIMREALRPMLPEYTLLKKKKGFDMPLDEWLIKRSAGYVRELLLDSRSLSRNYFVGKRLTEMVERFLAEKSDYASGSAATIISLMTLELWHRLFIDR
ncbi:MAG: asparagine synthase (glutamine-hydrolyzing) [Acidobacteria bacterium]|nr:asparagine synthase (glutamine-hydrolyzing) [Acidobacteriota bacterium]